MAAFHDASGTELYGRLGLTIRYNHANRTAHVTIDPGRTCTKLCPRPDVDLRYVPAFTHDLMID
jgi:hypothetical protein